MDTLLQIIYYILEVLKWLILARVLVSWLPMLGIHVDPGNPIFRLLYQITDPILVPLSRYTRVGAFDLSPIIAFFLITFIQNFLVGRSLAQTVAFAICLVIAFTVHEFAHAWTAYQLGDPTAKNQGRLSLDPRRHLDLLGSVMVLAVGFGWARPTPVNVDNLRTGRQGMAVVSVAGPASNLLLAILVAIPFRMGAFPALYSSSLIPNPEQLAYVFIWLNVILMVFNLFPIPPLDGFNILTSLVPDSTAQSLNRFSVIGPVILLVLIFLAGGIFTTLVMAPTQFIVGLLV